MFNDTLDFDPFNAAAKEGLETAQKQLATEVAAGSRLARLALPPPEPDRQVGLLPAAAPMYKIAAADTLPARLLRPQQAERDERLRDIYSFVTIRSDVMMPKRYIK